MNQTTGVVTRYEDKNEMRIPFIEVKNNDQVDIFLGNGNKDLNFNKNFFKLKS